MTACIIRGELLKSLYAVTLTVDVFVNLWFVKHYVPLQ